MLPYYKTNSDNVKANPSRYNYPVLITSGLLFLIEKYSVSLEIIR
jgi:hypothetical protein